MADDRSRKLEERYEGYQVYDNAGEKIGKVDELFVDEDDREEYIGVKMGLFGLSGTTLIPAEIARVDDQGKAFTVSETKDRVKDAPTYSNDDEVDDDYENRIRSYFGLERQESSDRGSYSRRSEADPATEGASPSATGGEGYREENREAREQGVGDRGERRDHDEPARDTERGGELEPHAESQEVPVRHEEHGREGEPAGQWDEEYDRQEEGARTRVRRRSRSQERVFEEEEEEERFGR